VSRLRLLVLLTGLGALVAGAPARASVTPDPARAGHDEPRALRLLDRAASAAVTRSWRGTQYTGSWRDGVQSSSVLEVRHVPAVGSTITVLAPAAQAGRSSSPPDLLDTRLLALLADRYALVVVGAGSCAGRPARVVEAHRRGQDGPAAVAGRFWIDDASGLVLRYEVLDEQGRTVRSSAFVDLVVTPDPAEAVPDLPANRPATTTAVAEMDWEPPPELPGGLGLYDVQLRRHRGAEVLQAAYSDGLSTLSVFVQRGEVHGQVGDGSVQQGTGRATVWVRPGTPERVVWSGGGHTWTLLSDAPTTAVDDAVRALPHAPLPHGDGAIDRLGRGLSRVGSWLNPFD
jgi:hypothetical protein